MALVGVFGDRITRAYSLPGLKQIGSASLEMMDGSRSADSIVDEDGNVFCWTGPSEIAILSVWGAGGQIENTKDVLVNPNLRVPPRPTISNVQWLSGTQYITPTDLDLLIGGPDRPPSKRMIEATAAEKSGAAGKVGPQVREAEGWGEYLTRSLNERTEKLNLMGDAMDNAADASQKWADGASKWAGQQKKKMILGGLTGKFL
jgi:syntaxin-binding protein 5